MDKMDKHEKLDKIRQNWINGAQKIDFYAYSTTDPGCGWQLEYSVQILFLYLNATDDEFFSGINRHVRQI